MVPEGIFLGVEVLDEVIFPAVVVVSDKEICSAVVVEPCQRLLYFFRIKRK